MSRYSIVAKRYAKALYEVASEWQQAEAVEQHLGTLVERLEESKELATFMESPNVVSQSKAEVVKELLGENLPSSLYNAIRLLFDRDRDGIFPDLFHAYVSVANEALGRAVAEVYAPYELSEAEQSQIADAFQSLIGKQITVKSHIDERLLGGVKVRIGDRLYDGSVASHLKRIEYELNSTQAM